MKSKLTTSAMFLALSLCIQNLALGQDCPACDHYLDVIYDKVSIQRTDDFKQSFSSWFFSDDFEKQVKNNKIGLSITVPIEGVPITFGGNDESADAWEKRQQNMGSTKWDFSKISKSNIYTQIATPQSRKQWYNCLATCPQTPLPVTISSTDDDGAIITFKYNANVITSGAPTYRNFVCTGSLSSVEANRIFQGKKMTLGGEAIKFKWKDLTSDKGSVVLNTNKGSTVAIYITRVLKTNGLILTYFTTRNGDWNNSNEIEKVQSANTQGLSLGMSNVTDGGCPIRSDDAKYCAIMTHIFQVAVHPGEFLTNLNYHSIPCAGCNAGWSKVLYSTPNNAKTYMVEIMVKNWGPASMWQLDFDVYRSKIITKMETINVPIVNNNFDLSIPKNASYPNITLNLINKRNVQFTPDGNLPAQVSLMSRNDTGETINYTFKINN